MSKLSRAAPLLLGPHNTPGEALGVAISRPVGGGADSEGGLAIPRYTGAPIPTLGAWGLIAMMMLMPGAVIIGRGTHSDLRAPKDAKTD